MSVIIRLQGLPWTANALDIRKFFQGLSIPDGGVHIIGGASGDAFIAFTTDEDARRAMTTQGVISGQSIKLLLSSKTEMQNVIVQARSAPSTPGLKQGGPGGARMEPHEGHQPSRAPGPGLRNEPFRAHSDRPPRSRLNNRGSFPEQVYQDPETQKPDELYPQAGGPRHNDLRGRGPWTSGNAGMQKGFRESGMEGLEPRAPDFGINNRAPPDQRRQPPEHRAPEHRRVDVQVPPDPRRSPRQGGYNQGGMGNYKGLPGPGEPAVPRRPEHHRNVPGGPPMQREPDHLENNQRGFPDKPGSPGRRRLDRGDPSLNQSWNSQRGIDDRPGHDFDTRMIELRRSPDMLPVEPAFQHRDIDHRDHHGPLDRFGPDMMPDQGYDRPRPGVEDEPYEREPAHINDAYNHSDRDSYRAKNGYGHRIDSGSHMSIHREPEPVYRRAQGMEREIHPFGIEARERRAEQEEPRSMPERREHRRDRPVDWNQDQVHLRPQDVETDGGNFGETERAQRKDVRYSQRSWEEDGHQRQRNFHDRIPGVEERYSDRRRRASVDRQDDGPPPLKRPLLETPQHLEPMIPRRISDSRVDDQERVCAELSNMPFTVRYEDLHRLFQGIQIARDGIKLCNDHKGRRNGTGVVKFASSWDFEEAMKLNYAKMGGRALKIGPCRLEDFERADDPYVLKEEDYSKRHRRPGMDERPAADSGLWLELSGLHPRTERGDVRNFLHGLQWAEGSLFVEYDHSGSCLGNAYLEMGCRRDFELALRKSGREPVGRAHSIVVSFISWKEMRDRVDNHKMKYSKAPHVDRSSSLRKYPFSVFIEGLPFEADSKLVADFFRPLSILDRGISIIRDKTGLATGKAYVDFAKRADFEEALKRNKQYIGNRYITVYRKGVSRGPPFSRLESDAGTSEKTDILQRVDLRSIGRPGCVLLANNLPYEATKLDIVNFFQRYRPVSDSVKIHTDGKGLATGDALVGFKSIGDAKAAQKDLNLTHMQGRPIRISQVHM